MTFSKTQWHKMSANYGHASLAEVSASHLLLQGGGGFALYFSLYIKFN